MDLKQARAQAVRAAVARVHQLLDAGVSPDRLQDAKTVLLELAGRAELFPLADFPLPEGKATDRTFLLSETEKGEFALYANSGISGQTSRPHNHGGAWAIVVAVRGQETHRVYRFQANGDKKLEAYREIEVEPGSGIALMPDAIHSIHATEPGPLLHLHMYGLGFAKQGTRLEFDLERGTSTSFVLMDIGVIEDRQ